MIPNPATDSKRCNKTANSAYEMQTVRRMFEITEGFDRPMANRWSK